MGSEASLRTATFGWPFALWPKRWSASVAVRRLAAPRRVLGLTGTLPLLICCTLAVAGEAKPEWKSSLAVFQHLSPLASSQQLARRTQTPTTADRMARYLDSAGKSLVEHTIDIGDERFDIYVPAATPAAGYGVLVWIPPSDDGQSVPRAWRGVLERHGIIYVAPRAAGNGQTLVKRRIPLAVHAAHNLALEYGIVPSRVFVGGFSGGARAALRAAVAYPDVFHGALLSAGSDEIGSAMVAVPPAQLVELLQARSQLVYVTGARDLPNRRMEERSRESAARLCISNVHRLSVGRAGHAPPDARAFAKAMQALDSKSSGSVSLDACRARLRQQVDAALAEVEALAAAGRLQEAGVRLDALDQRWGGLAAPRSVILARRLAAPAHDSGGAAQFDRAPHAASP